MKLTKTVKYNYKITEETLEKDIDKFIFESKRGAYQMDRHSNSEGLKIIKQYLKIINEKFKQDELKECKECYRKLIPFLFYASGGQGENLFDYEDLLAKISSDFEQYIKNYFTCLMKTCDIEELADAVSEYAIALDIYGFDSDKEILLGSLNKEQLNQLEERMLIKTEGMTKKNQDKHDILYFLLNLVQERGDKERYIQLCNRFKGVLGDKELNYLIEEWEDGEDKDKWMGNR